jgi:acetyltransferase
MTADRRPTENLAAQPSTLTTRDGYTLSTRLIRPDDAPLLLDLFEQLSSESRRRRFHAGMDHLSEEYKQQAAAALAHVDNRTQGGAVLAIDPRAEGGEQIVGVARLARPEDRPEDEEAEAAITVRDDFQQRGVGTQLLRRLVLLARQMGIQTLVALIEADNEPALKVFRSLNLPTETHIRHAEVEMRIALTPQE